MTHHKEASQAIVNSVSLPEVEMPEEGIPRAIVPWNKDDDRSRFLGLRASGFGIRDTLNLIGKAKSTLSLWRTDPVFKELEDKIPELRKTLALEYASLEFLRNYRLVMEKDYRILKKSLSKNMKLDKDGNAYEAPMESQDFQYLLKARPFYTPQQLQAIEQLFTKDDGGGEFNWTDFVMTLSRTKEEVKIETRHRQPSELSPIVEGELVE